MKDKLTFSSLLVLALLLTLPPTILASTTWYVNGVSGSDGNNCLSPTTPCKTIGHAIALAASGDIVHIAAATYVENLTIGISLRITGAGAKATIIDGNSVGTVITIPSANAQITISNITIRNGNGKVQGGGIYNNGTLTVDYTTISGNVSRGNRSQAGLGGGVYSTGTLTVNYSTISGNMSSSPQGGYGGGIFNSGRLTINASLISGNGVGGAGLFFARASGGGIFNGGSVTINNSTLYGNGASCGNILQHCASSEGGGISNGGLVVINNSTLYGNSAREYGQKFVPLGGGIYNVGQVQLQNSILADNVTQGHVNSPSNCYGSVTSNGYNMSDDGTCAFHNSGDRNTTNPMLAPLQYNGGPTQTMALPSGSPAIDAGNPSGCTDGSGHLLKTDQRGYPRPDSEDKTKTGCDMGAYEKQSD